MVLKRSPVVAVARREQSRITIDTVRAMAGIVSCSIVIAHRRPDTNWADLDARREAPEAHGLISVSEESWPEVPGSSSRRAVVSVEANNTDSVRWYAHEILHLRQGHPSWQDMERQLGRYDGHPGHR
jgi:hypothetical protein